MPFKCVYLCGGLGGKQSAKLMQIMLTFKRKLTPINHQCQQRRRRWRVSRITRKNECHNSNFAPIIITAMLLHFHCQKNFFIVIAVNWQCKNNNRNGINGKRESIFPSFIPFSSLCMHIVFGSGRAADADQITSQINPLMVERGRQREGILRILLNPQELPASLIASPKQQQQQL